MSWDRKSFMDAVKQLLKEFENHPEAMRLALVWRTPDEYSIMDEWLLSHICSDFDGATLRVCMWLTRREATELVVVFREVK